LILIIKPPPTRKEQKIAEVNKNFTIQIIGQLIIAYVVASLLIGFISSSIAQSSWDECLKNGSNGYGRYYSYIPEMNVKVHEDRSYWYQYYQTGFWFYRPFKAFGSTIYLSQEEQNNIGLLWAHLMLSSFVSLSFIFIIIGIIYYAIKRTDLKNHS
jgi:hypothetical protein